MVSDLSRNGQLAPFLWAQGKTEHHDERYGRGKLLRSWQPGRREEGRERVREKEEGGGEREKRKGSDIR